MVSMTSREFYNEPPDNAYHSMGASIHEMIQNSPVVTHYIVLKMLTTDRPQIACDDEILSDF